MSFLSSWMTVCPTRLVILILIFRAKTEYRMTRRVSRLMRTSPCTSLLGIISFMTVMKKRGISMVAALEESMSTAAMIMSFL